MQRESVASFANDTNLGRIQAGARAVAPRIRNATPSAALVDFLDVPDPTLAQELLEEVDGHLQFSV